MEHSVLSGISSSNPSFQSLGNLMEEKAEKGINSGGDGGDQENKALSICQANLKRLKQLAHDLHRTAPATLHICYMTSSLSFLWESWVCGWGRFLSHVTSLGFFSFYLVAVSKFDVMVFLFSYYILFFKFCCFCLENCSSIVGDRKGVDPDRRVGGKKLGGVEVEETVINIYCMRKYFKEVFSLYFCDIHEKLCNFIIHHQESSANKKSFFSISNSRFFCKFFRAARYLYVIFLRNKFYNPAFYKPASSWKTLVGCLP